MQLGQIAGLDLVLCVYTPILIAGARSEPGSISPNRGGIESRDLILIVSVFTLTTDGASTALTGSNCALITLAGPGVNAEAVAMWT